MDYVYKLQPFAHQRAAFERSRDAEAFALLMEMGTGKTKVAIDTACYLHSRGKIGCLVVLAPKGVHSNWTRKEAPKHVPDWCEYAAAHWVSGARKADKAQMARIDQAPAGLLRIIAVNYDALITKPGRAWLERAMRLYGPTLMVLDESHRIKTPSAKRTKVVQTFGKRAAYRRVLTGTVLTNSPLDFYSQFKFLDGTILEQGTFTAFKAEYAVLLDPWHPLVRHAKKRVRFGTPQIIATDDDGNQLFRNQEQLRERVAPHTFFARKAQCTDIPEKIYAPPRYFDMAPEQRSVYNEMLEHSLVELFDPERPPDGGNDTLFDALSGANRSRAKNALVKLTRLQQIAGGFITLDDGETRTLGDARVKALLDTLDDVDGNVIVWARYVREIEVVVAALRERYGDDQVVEYYGATSDDDRVAAVEAFESRRARFFVSNPQAGGEGIDLISATTVIYYTQSYNFKDRAQSEDRAHRIGQTQSVTYLTLIANATIDERVDEALQRKADILDEYTTPLEAA